MSSQRLPHVLPERCRRVFNLPEELLVGSGDGLPELEAGKIRVPASVPCVGDVTKDARRSRAGRPLFELARFTGTSVDQIDRTYRHLLPDALDRTRTALDTFLTASEDVAGER